MTSPLRRNLELLERRLLILANKVEEGVRRSISALLDRRLHLAKKGIEGDADIDRREVDLEEECLKALALHQPVATDLRFVAACLKINNDLERIGDLAVNIAERALSLAEHSSFPIPDLIGTMVEDASGMLRDSIEAFIKGDSDLARRVCEHDDRVDKANRQVISAMLRTMHQDPQNIDPAVEVVTISKSLERIADHATNIAEDVIYLVEGDIIRHSLGLQKNP